MSEIKALLKDAAKLIKEKDVKGAIVLTKKALKIDSKHYQSLAIHGRACMEVENYEEAKNYLQKACEVDAKQVVAWQGLTALYEKCPSVFEAKEAIEILETVTKAINDEEKLCLILQKLGILLTQTGDTERAIETYTRISSMNNEKAVQSARKSLIQLISNNKLEKFDELLLDSLRKSVNNSVFSENEDNHKLLLKTLFRLNIFPECLDAADNMAKIFPDFYPLQWICRIYTILKTSDEFPELIEQLDERIDKDLSTLSNNLGSWGVMAQGIRYKEQKEDTKAVQCLKDACDLFGINDLLPWKLRMDLQKNMHDITGLEVTCRKLVYLIDETKNEEKFAEFRSSVVVAWANVLNQMGHDNHVKLALKLLNNQECDDPQINSIRIKAYIKLEDFDAAYEELAVMKKFGETLETRLFDASILLKKGLHEEALVAYQNILVDNPNSSDAHLGIGRIYFDTKDFKNALISLLKAAKYDSSQAGAFLYLGHYYKSTGNLDKARKCYEKAFTLNPCDNEAGATLSDVYRTSGQHELNMALLEKVTTEIDSKIGSWAWLRLGLHYLAVNSYEEAIRALQAAVKINPRDSVCFECLGDAYLARGSHTAALKVYTHAIKLSKDQALYSRSQIAYLKHITGEFLESVKDYENVLMKSCPVAIQVVAMTGLAQVLITRARKFRSAQLLINVRDDCLYAIDCLAKVADMQPHHMTVWKLLGDACALQASLPESLSPYEVPTSLLQRGESGQSFVSKKELLQLGSKCLGMAIKISNSDANLWHDLGLLMFLQEWESMDCVTGRWNVQEEQIDDLQKSVNCLKKSLVLDPINATAWNTLGVVSFFAGNIHLAQHSFLRSLDLRPSVQAWTNLGVLYFKQSKDRKENKDQLAHQAYSRAQALDPSFVAAWIGQGFIAENIKHEDIFKLFHHPTTLGIHPEASIGHGHHLLKSIVEGKSDKDRYIINAADSMLFYVREKEKDVVGLNLCGLLLEMIGLKYSACRYLSQAAELCSQNESIPNVLKDAVFSNYGRLLTSLNKTESALRVFEQIKDPDFYSSCGVALALVKSGDLSNAHKSYSSISSWYAETEEEKSNILVALACLFYKIGDLDSVKTLLFQCCSGKGSKHALISLGALGLIKNETNMCAAAISELDKNPDDPQLIEQIVLLKASYAFYKKNALEAKLILCRAVHNYPNKAGLWRSLARIIMMSKAESSTEAVLAASSAALALSQAAKDNKEIYQDVIMRAISCVTGEQRKKSKKLSEEKRSRGIIEAQKAVIMFPNDARTWAVLASAVRDSKKASKISKAWVDRTSEPLNSWFKSRVI